MNIEHHRKLTAPEASEYLLQAHGIRRTSKTLAKLRTVGGGPPFFKAGAQVLYDSIHCDEWATKLLGSPRRSTSDTPAERQAA